MVNVLVGVTGSVASIKLPLLLQAIADAAVAASTSAPAVDSVSSPKRRKHGPAQVADQSSPETAKKQFLEQLSLKVVSTAHAKHFFKQEDLGDVPLLTDEDEWTTWTKMSDPLRNWADVFVIAPLDANTMAKAVHGICDNLLTCILRAWDVSKPVLVCPAMNTHMWTHPTTAKHLLALKQDLGYTIIDPISKRLACGDIGIGAMANPQDIARETIASVLEYHQNHLAASHAV
eukprot:jgi/Hompol1/5838/HPOL_004745-RA